MSRSTAAVARKALLEVSTDEVEAFYSTVAQKALGYKNRNGNFEENFRQDVNFLLRGLMEIRGIDTSIENEFSLKGGRRIDSLIDKVIIEYKSPGLLKPDNGSGKNPDGIEKAKAYIEGLSAKEKRKKDRYRGFCFDGYFLIVCYFRADLWVVEEPIPFSKGVGRILLNTILAVKQEFPFTPENLAREFGPSSKVAKVVIEAFHRSLVKTKNRKVKDLFLQWQVMFSQASEFVHAKKKLKQLIKIYHLKIEKGYESEILFSVHTYLGILMKLIAVDVVTLYSGMAPFTRSISNLKDGRFLAMLKGLEQGDPFYQSGIDNFLEADYFSWYLEDAHKDVISSIRAMFKKFEQFDAGTLSVDPFQTSDLLKNLYQVLIPRPIRHDLGEYYTPDWLAEHLVDGLGYGDDAKNLRLIDPSCGTGTFLCIAIRKVRKILYSQQCTDHEVLKGVLSNVVGLDLNPVAVIAARTNYLIGLNTSLAAARERGEQISIPVYLCDSLLAPTKEDSSDGKYKILTSVGELSFPASLAEADVFSTFYDCLKNGLAAEIDVPEFAKLLSKRKIGVEVDSLASLYGHLLKLHKEGRDGIWANIIKNSFAPKLIGKFNYVAGNPPWINWEHLPDHYRSNLSGLWEKYQLFDLSGMASVLGGSKRDISALFTYVCIDQFLSPKGQLGFVIPQTLLKNVQSAEGFRKFSLTKKDHFRVEKVDDMVELKPFDAANRTAVIFVKKDGKTTFPVPYTIWTKSVKKKFDNDFSLEQIKKMSKTVSCAAIPVDSKNQRSPWLTLPSEVSAIAGQYLGESSYKAIEGANSGGLNGFYFVRIKGRRQGNDFLIENCRERIKVPVPKIEEIIEGKYIYPLLLGREVDSFSATPSQYILMLQDPATRKGIDQNTLRTNSLRLYNLLQRPKIDRLLKQRATFRRYYKETDPAWSMFNVSKSTFSPFKVVWREQTSTFKAAVVGAKDDEFLGQKVIVPDHKLMMIGLNSSDEAHFVCGFLNSFIVKLIVKGYSVDTSISTHVTGFVKIPTFDANDELHGFLRDSSVRFHSTGGFNSIEFDTLLANRLGLADKTLQHVWSFLS